MIKFRDVHRTVTGASGSQTSSALCLSDSHELHSHCRLVASSINAFWSFSAGRRCQRPEFNTGFYNEQTGPKTHYEIIWKSGVIWESEGPNDKAGDHRPISKESTTRPTVGEHQHETKGQFLYQRQIKRSPRRNQARGGFLACVSVSPCPAKPHGVKWRPCGSEPSRFRLSLSL